MDLETCLSVASMSAGSPVSISAPTPAEIEAMLDFTRAVAHASERRAAPLAAYAVGLAWAHAQAGERVLLLRRATAAIDAVVTAAPPAPDEGRNR